MPVNHSNDQHGVMTLTVNSWHTHLSRNRQLSKCTSDLLIKRDIMPSTGNADNCPGRVKSWTSEENLQPPLY